MAALQALLLTCFVAYALSHGYPSGVHVGHFPASYPDNSKDHYDPKKPVTPEPKKPKKPEPTTPEPEPATTPEPEPATTPEPEPPTTPEPKKPKGPSDADCTPSEWEGQAIGRVVIDSKPVSSYMFKSNISVSHSCQMEVYESTTKVSSKQYIKTKTYRDFKSMKEFEVDLDTGKCKVARKITVSMKRVCKGANDVKFIRSFLVGGQKANMIQTTNYGFVGTSITTLMEGSNIPVSAIATNTADDGSKQYISLQYANIKAGCKDKSVFYLPKACKALSHGKSYVQG